MKRVRVVGGVYPPAPVAHTSERWRDVGGHLDLWLEEGGQLQERKYSILSNLCPHVKSEYQDFTYSYWTFGLQHKHNTIPLCSLVNLTRTWTRDVTYLWLRQDDHANQVHAHVGAQGHVSQQLWRLRGYWSISQFNIFQDVHSVMGL